MAATPPDNRDWYEWWTDQRGLRWALVVVLLAVAGVLLAIGAFGETCKEVVAQVGDQPVAEACSEPSFTDLPVLVGLAFVLMLLWPDLSEVSVGFVQLKRTVQQNQESTGKQLADLRLQIMQVAVTQTQEVSVHYGLPRGDLDAEQVDSIARESAGLAEGALERRAESKTRDEIINEFLRAWSAIEMLAEYMDEVGTHLLDDSTFERIPDGGRMFAPFSPRSVTKDEDRRIAVLVRDTFVRDEVLLKAGRSARNLLVHGTDSVRVSDEAVVDLTGSLSALIDQLRRQITASLSSESGG